MDRTWRDTLFVLGASKSSSINATSSFDHSVCNQPRKKRCSNLVVVLIPTASVPKGAQVIDLNVSIKNQPVILFSSDGGPIDEQLEAEDIDPDVQYLLVAQKTSKVSYEATRHFQDTWAAKLH